MISASIRRCGIATKIDFLDRFPWSGICGGLHLQVADINYFAV
ncbi:MAG: hypothetical protein R3C28_31995 [Pirellulaceae bacterium]